MLIHRIFQRPQIKRPTRRRHRFITGLSLEMLSLESRIPLSSGLLQTIEMPDVARSFDVDLFISARPSVPAIATALAEVGDRALETGTGTATTESDAAGQSPSVTWSLGQTTSSTVVEFNLNPTDGGAVVAISSTSSSEEALAGSPVQTADATAGQGRITQMLQSHPLIESAVSASKPAIYSVRETASTRRVWTRVARSIPNCSCR